MTKPKRSHYRFFVDPEVITDTTVVIKDADLIHQMSRVFRMQAGDAVVLLDNTGYEYRVILQYVGAYEITGQVEERSWGQSEPVVPIILYMPVLKGSKNEYILEKATELGVSEIVPVVFAHSIVREVVSKFERWNTIIREAAEQSHRSRLPILREEIEPSQIFAHAPEGRVYVLGDEGEVPRIDQVLRGLEVKPREIAVIIGPEGGLNESERAFCLENGSLLMSLAKTVLRADTAAILATGAIAYFVVE